MMAAFYDSCTSPAGQVTVFLLALLLLAQFYILLQTIQLGRNKGLWALQALHILCGFVLLCALLSGMDPDYPLAQQPRLMQLVYALPWAAIAGLELLSVLLLALSWINNRRVARQLLTPFAIKCTLDTLPLAVCFGDEGGRVAMANLRMSRLCRRLTGYVLTDTQLLWEAAVKAGEDQGGKYLVRMPEGEVLLFSKSSVTVGGRLFDQITAADVTDEYRITEELMAKNKRLRDVQYRMKALGARETALRIPREIMQARRAVHDHMGNVLLTGKNYLDHGSLDEADLLRLMQFNNRFLLGEAEQPEPPRDLIHEAVELSRRTGITVAISGEVPRESACRALLAQTIEQCAANAVRHAGADRLTVQLSARDARLYAVFRNNGDAPEKPIRETGGLAALRQSVEAAGGSMTVQSEPDFSLTLCLPHPAQA